MLHFILGRTGSGKSNYIHKLFKELVDNNTNNLLVIVPEQQSFETEKDFLTLLGAQKSKNVTVTSFSRLFDIVLRETGGLAREYINDSSRNILMNLAIEQAENQLDLYKKQIKKTEFSALVLTALKEFKACNVSTDTLRKTAIKTKELSLKKKLNEISIIIDIYDGLIKNSYIDPLDNLTHLYNKLLKYKLFDNYTVAIDSFTSFSLQEQKIIEQLLIQCKDVYVSLDGNNLEYSSYSRLFETTKITKKNLEELAKNNFVEIAKDTELIKNINAQNKELQCLEENIFRISSENYNLLPENISLYEANNIYDECDFISRKIRELIIDKGYMYKDITIIARDLSTYRGVLDTTLNKFNISYFMDKPRDIESKPLIVFVLSLFEIMSGSLNSDYIFRLLKTGLTKLSYDEISELENYTYTWNISGKKWLDKFLLNPRGFSESFSEEDNKVLLKIEETRKYVIEPLISFKKSLTNATGKEISQLIYKILFIYDTPNQLKELAESYQKSGCIELAKEQASVWKSLMSILNTMAVILSDKPISYKRYYDLFKNAITVTDIAYIPINLDHVTIGCADRIRPVSPKAVFVIGANDGEFPMTPATKGIFSNSERKMLISLKLPIHNSLEELASKELLIAYMAISAPSEKLFISYYNAELSGKTKSPSPIISEITKIFPHIKTDKSSTSSWLDKLWAEQQALEELIIHENTNNNTIEVELQEHFKSSKLYKDTYAKINSFKFDNKKHITQLSLTDKLYGTSLNLSASQIEKFYLCQFNYFCRYGLRARERKKAEINPSEYGSFIHYILESILKDYSINDLKKMDRDEQEHLLDNLISYYLQNYLGGENDKTSRFLYLFRRVKSTAITVLTQIIKELSQSKFTPIDFELNIGNSGDIPPYKLTLQDEKSVVVSGFIDRVDIMKESDKSYIRIIDYKTGKKKFILSDIKFGLNMQMLIYLSAICKNGKEKYGNIIPAGVLYLHSDVKSVIAAPTDTEENIIKKIEKNYIMSGVILEDEKVINGMEDGAQGKYIPVVLSDGTTKKGSEYLLNNNQLDRVFNEIDKHIEAMATKIYGGEIYAVPAKGSYDACMFCPFGTSCNYNENMGSNIIYADSSFKETLSEEISGKEKF